MFVYKLLMDTESRKSKILKRKAALNVTFCVKKERNSIYQKVSTLLQKSLSERSADEIEFLDNSKDVVQQITQRKAQRQKIKDRAQEFEDAPDVLAEKCKILAEAVINSNHLVVYTGAGISTAACIPDYRGSNGIWTLLQQGKDIGLHDLSRAEPTLTHMALYCLYRSGILKHVVSQNCDGLHLRSGVPRSVLSEVHGNMYLEVCSKCKPSNHFLRLFDVTENTARYSHETLRLCYKCGSSLKDTIVHFGERGKLQWPLNWDTACKQADKADVILCLGSSLKVLKKYPWLWCMDKPVKKRPKLYIVNLQWTPKDEQSTLKINGKCDTVIEQVMSHLGLTIPKYVRSLDPIFHHATILHELEMHTTTRSPIEKNPRATATEQKSISDGDEVAANNLHKVSDDNTDSMCSSPQDIIRNKSTCDDEVHTNDLINSKNLVLVKEIKEESNANSDKENDVEIDETKVKLEDDGQSELTVINEKLEIIVPEVIEKSEMEIKVEERESINVTSSNVDMYEGMHFLFGRNLWSDLSLFDALTNQPILFNHSVFGFSGLNTCASLVPYYNPSMINYFDFSNNVPNTTDTPPQCSTSSSNEQPTEEIVCSFCHEYYQSKGCLFYLTHSSNTPLDSTSPCLCCGGEDEDEEEEEDESLDKTPTKVPNVNPGWFGKGYKKKIKKRK